MKKERDLTIALIAMLNFSNQIQNMKVDQVGHSFYEALLNAFETKTDYLIGYARTEYHCKIVEAHHGHILKMVQNLQVKDTVIMVFVTI